MIFDGEGITLLMVEDVNLLRMIFVAWKICKFLAVGWCFTSSPEFPIKV